MNNTKGQYQQKRNYRTKERKHIVTERKEKSQQNETIERKERNIYITQREQQDYVSPYGTMLVRAITKGYIERKSDSKKNHFI